MAKYDIPQISLFADISNLISKKYKIKTVGARHMNAIIAAANAICAEFGRDDRHAPKNGGLQVWLASDDIGMSSRYMASILAPLAGMGQVWCDGINYPHDPDDFWRCLNLLECVPEFRAHLPALSDKHPIWAGYVARWAEMEALFKEEEPTGSAPKLYALMKSIQSTAKE